MGKFDGYLLVSDLDGTLIGRDHSVSDENVTAIREFVAEGGRFLGATGRTELNVRPYTVGIPLSSPWILYNGAAIYDWERASFIYKAPLPRSLAEAFVVRVMAQFRQVNVQVYAGGPFCQVNPDGQPDAIAVREQQAFEDKPVEAITDDWLKVLFCSDVPEHLDGIEALFESDPLRSVAHSMRSGPSYYEVTAQGVNKGTALAHLKMLLDPAPSRVVAIGDYNNDIEMLKAADMPAAPESALDEVKQHATIITACHSRSAIADLIRILALPGQGS